jgi:hypothetical protein
LSDIQHVTIKFVSGDMSPGGTIVAEITPIETVPVTEETGTVTGGLTSGTFTVLPPTFTVPPPVHATAETPLPVTPTPDATPESIPSEIESILSTIPEEIVDKLRAFFTAKPTASIKDALNG